MARVKLARWQLWLRRRFVPIEYLKCVACLVDESTANDLLCDICYADPETRENYLS